MQEQLENLLDEICMPSNLIGYQYWIDVIQMIIKHDTGTYRIYMEKLYRDLARKYNVSRDSIEKSLRYAKSKSNIKGKSNKIFLLELLKIYNRRYK